MHFHLTRAFHQLYLSLQTFLSKKEKQAVYQTVDEGKQYRPESVTHEFTFPQHIFVFLSVLHRYLMILPRTRGFVRCYCAASFLTDLERSLQDRELASLHHLQEHDVN